MVNLFLDTDMGPDCDDAGALQIIHTLCRKGMARLLGVTCCTSSPCCLATVSAINRANGLEVPLGITARRGFLDSENCLRYASAVAERYDHEFKDGRTPRAALDVFREVLSRQPDGSVTMLSIGPMNNLADYLSDGETASLISRKVTKTVCMAGRFDKAVPEWNIQMDIPAAKTVVERWPAPLVLCGWECGKDIITGAALEGREGHPVREAYRLWTNGSLRRDSYDLSTALYAVLGDSGWIGTSQPGKIAVSPEGVTTFEPHEGGPHRYTYLRVPKEKLAGYLNALL